jgi:hypothetical protein
VLAVLGMKVLVLVVAAVTATILAGHPPESLRTLVGQWDASHYLTLASEGYGSATAAPELIVHPPLFPLLVAALAIVTRDVALSGLVVTAIGAIACVLLLDRLARRDLGPAGAAAPWVLLTFPTAYALHLPLSDGVFLALALGAFLSAQDGRWAPAGAFAALATLTRVTGALLLPALAVEALLDARRTGRVRLAWAWLALIPAAYAAYLGMNWLVTGDPFAFVTAYRVAWGKQLDWPWIGIAQLFRLATDPANGGPLWWGEIVFVFGGLAAVLATALRLPPSYAVWVGGSWLLSTSTTVIASTPRYTLAMFPLFLLLAPAMRSPLWRRAITILGIALQLLLAARFVTQQWAY